MVTGPITLENLLSAKSIFATFRNTGSDERGSFLIEFALVGPIMVTLLLGIIEIGMILFTTTLLEGSLRDASRFGITGRVISGENREGTIAAIVEDRTLGLVDMSKATLDILVYPDFGSIGTGESFVDGNGNGTYDTGETYDDANENGAWDEDIGVAGAGDAGDVVLYRIRYEWPFLIPFIGDILSSGTPFALSASIAVRNEPWEILK